MFGDLKPEAAEGTDNVVSAASMRFAVGHSRSKFALFHDVGESGVGIELHLRQRNGVGCGSVAIRLLLPFAAAQEKGGEEQDEREIGFQNEKVMEWFSVVRCSIKYGIRSARKNVLTF